MFYAVFPAAIVRAGNTVHYRVNDLVSSDMCQMPGNVGKLSNIIIIRFDFSLLSDHIAENNLN